MVATLLRIRFRILGNTLARNPWQLVGFLFGAFGALTVLALAGAGLFFVGTLGLDPARYAITLSGAVLTLGWVIGPIFVAGVDTTLDPAKLAPFPMTTGRMMLAITAGGATGVPGIAAAVGVLATFAVWWRWPSAAAAAIIAVPLGYVLCVVASRTVAALASGLSGNRRAREAIAFIAFGVLIFASPIFLGVVNLVRAAEDQGAELATVVEGLSWTPIAAAWAIPGDVAAGALVPAVAKLTIALATLAALWFLWYRSLAASLVAPPARAGGPRAAAGKLGWFGVMPASGLGATWARSLTNWLRDARYTRLLLFIPFIPVVVLLYTGWDTASPWFLLSGVILAFWIGILPYTDISYDGTAFGTVLQTGITGRAERAGRMLGAAALGVPLALIADVVLAAITDTWHLLPAVIGASLALLGAGYGVSAVSSALLVIPAPDAGDNPFKRVPGASFAMLLAFLGCWVIAALVASPAVIPGVIAVLSGDAVLGWIALGIGIVISPVAFSAGVVVGGRVFDRTAPTLYARLRALKGS